MKTVFLVSATAILTLLTSCKKCGECSVKENNVYNKEYCTGNAIEDAIYEDAKEECEYLGGTFG